MFDQEFFPTPGHVIGKMLAKLKISARHFLEPNAGKGDIAEAIQAHRGRYSETRVDCIEQSPELCAILETKEHISLVGYDWLTYDGVCYYDAIVMNPPFSNGDAHLLKAWDFMHSGEIVCLLNAETIANPYSATRKRLVAIIEEHGDTENLGDCFSSAERKTDVEVVMVYLKKEAEDDSADLWASDLTDEKEVNDTIGEANSLVIPDNLGNMQHFYDEANMHMFKAFQHIRKAAIYMGANSINFGHDDINSIMGLARENVNHAKAEFSRSHRNKAWHEVFSKMEFHKWLDKKQREEFIRDIDRHGNVPFTADNIKGTLRNVFEQRTKLFEKSVANVFDELTRYYKGNTNHTEGWKSNENFKVSKRIVFPWGCTFDKDPWRKFHTHWGRDMDVYNDLDRVLCVMEGADFAKCHTIGKVMEAKFVELGGDVRAPFDNNCQSEFFDIKFYMKGTVHLKWRDAKLRDLFNKTAAAGKAWLGQDTKGD